MSDTEKCKSEHFTKRTKIPALPFHHPASHSRCSGTREPARHLSNDEGRSGRDDPAVHMALLTAIQKKAADKIALDQPLQAVCVAYTSYPCLMEAKAGRCQVVLSSGLHTEFQVSLPT